MKSLCIDASRREYLFFFEMKERRICSFKKAFFIRDVASAPAIVPKYLLLARSCRADLSDEYPLSGVKRK